jgi:hypothetical protein
MEKKYRSKLKPDTKKIGQLVYEKHWSVVGLVSSLKYTTKELEKWAKLNKQS